jgi:hypothetical protein
VYSSDTYSVFNSASVIVGKVISSGVQTYSEKIAYTVILSLNVTDVKPTIA